MTTAQFDNNRTGANLSEAILKTSNVNAAQFGKLFSRAVDGYIYAQPLYVSAVNISGAVHNVVYVATMNDTVYAFDADDPNVSAPLWRTSLGTAVPATTAYLPLDGTGGLAPATGILSTPVIDLNTRTLYAVALVLVANSPVYQLHALDITTGQERPNSPVTIQASVNATGPDSQNGVITFDAHQHPQRTGLLLLNQRIYFGFGSYADIAPYHGWVMAYDAATLQQIAALNLAPQGGGGIWQSGGGFSADSSGFIYLCTGNGDWDGTVNFGESCVKLDTSQGLSIADYFTPYNYGYQNSLNDDLGSGRALLIPGTTLMVTGGKVGLAYVLDRNNLGQQAVGNPNIIQQFNVGGKVFSGMAFWNNPTSPMLYVWGSNDTLKAYQFNAGQFNPLPASFTSITSPYGSALTVSSNGGAAGSGIVWATVPISSPGASAVSGSLHAFDATNLANELWNSNQNPSRDGLGNLAKFGPPTVANGKVYVPTFSNQLVVYGLLPSAPLSIAPASVILGASQSQPFTSNLPVTWSINPALGSITTAGIYTAPASVVSQQAVTVTARTLDNSQSATATITLTPVSVTVTPSTATLYASQGQQFSAQVIGSSNLSASWSISPGNTGAISGSGLYTAPGTILSAGSVTITATSVADNSKFGIATVVLNPIAPPVITEQPKSSTVFAGQTAVFTVAGSGGALTYQWQSRPPGGSVFSNIAGATSSTYTTAPAVVSVNGTQLRCVLSNSQGSIASNPATLTVLAGGQTYILGMKLGHLRNNFTGWVGMAVTVQSVPIEVTAIGRIAAPGNTGTHVLKIVDAATDTDVPGASVSINTNGVGTGTLVYQSLPAPVVLSAAHVYYVVSQESQGGDQWYDEDTSETTTQEAALAGPVFSNGSGYSIVPGSQGFSYVPLDFVYSAIAVTPVAAGLYAGQTQQFTATVVGLGSNTVSWTLSPNVGTITAAGLYTAPGLILASQTVTVTATSVVDTTKSISAIVTLLPVSVSVSPPVVTLFAGETQQFTSSVMGSADTAVTWSISPSSVGSISSGGLYTAPSPINTSQVVTVIATSVADSTKTGTATVTLSPPAPPSITRQPQNATVFAGQTAVFSITATGGGLTYQWQSKISGGATFIDIPGATMNSYTTPAALLSDGGTQFRCVVRNSQGTVQSNAASLAVLMPGSTFITNPTAGTLRNDFTGWVGMSITTGLQPLLVSSLGRFVASGNTAAHVVKIVTASGIDVPGASATVATAGVPAGTFSYTGLASPVSLAPNTTYYLISQEILGGDQWYDADTTAQTKADAILNGPVYGTPFTFLSGRVNHTYVPVDFVYTISISLSISPPAATLFGGQTQQFSATVTGTGNTMVTWSINPATGSISSTGLYTAPASISAMQTVAVKATSVADSTTFATATVTLNPPAPPVITQQPQNTLATVGQTAAFAVVATGAGLSYQWQQMLLGDANFSDIVGANSNIYTTPVLALADNGTQFRCLVSNAQGSVNSSAAILSVVPAGTPFVISKILGTIRNDYTGFVGMSLKTGTQPLFVTSLGRIAAPGNSSTHTVKIVNASTGTDLPGGGAVIDMAGKTPGTFSYTTLASPVVLSPNTTYYIVSQEVQGGDQWFDNNTTAQVTNDGVLAGAVYGTGQSYTVISASAGRMYVPVDFKYTIPVSVTVSPATADLYDGQTAQFIATVNGSGNTTVTWNINPETAGSISNTGLYTAPAPIITLQNVTVTATSAADSTKMASATVTLHPPSPPAITQQPQNASVSAGQTVTFTVVATGGALSYQWQSKPSGGIFTNLPNANSSFYTTPIIGFADNGTQFRCVVTNTQGSVTSNTAILTVTGSTFITSRTLGTLRDDFTGWVGMSVQVGPYPILVSALGRMVVAGNTNVHVVKIVTATGSDIASVSVATAGSAAGTFAYVSLMTPVRLNANTTYYLISQETAAGDQWYSSDTTAQTTTDGVLTGAVWGTAAPYNFVFGTAGHLYVPVDFKYTIPVSVSLSPAAVSLFDGGSQQFTATVAGTTNTAVIWSISPAGAGFISQTGLYTAPASITTQQTVTVTATSVADSSVSSAATVSLFPPAPPIITQQPQNAIASASQTVTFSVVALGTGLSYQWQSQAPGGTTFSNIPGATSSSYTTPGTALSDNGTQFRCIVTNAQGSVNTNSATLIVLPPGTPFITSKNLGTLRNDFSGWVGMSVTVGSQPLVVSALGRFVSAGNVNMHALKIVAASTGADVIGGSISVNTAAWTAGTFAYGMLASPVTLVPNTTYYILSQETQGGDKWYNNDTSAQTTTDAFLTASVWSGGSSYTAVPATSGRTYVPVDFLYTIPVSVSISPPAVILFAAQSQQFIASATGSNPAVSWSINPSTAGSITGTGLYTAPASISTQQIVTVTATSVADPTKLAAATVTLNPPAPPVITQQPQSVTATAGQSATFTVTAAGAGLNYQWQKMLPGGGAFIDIAGETSNTYTTASLTLSDNGSQFRCVVANAQGSTTSNAAMLTVLSGSPFIVTKILGTARNDFTGWVGMSVTVGSQALTVSALGRIVAPGNSAAHIVKIVLANTGTDLAGGATSVSTTFASAGSFAYSSLTSPVTLNANTTYYILSQEIQGGDTWYDYNTAAQTTSDANLSAAVWGTGSTYTAVPGTVGHMYVPVDFRYTIAGH